MVGAVVEDGAGWGDDGAFAECHALGWLGMVEATIENGRGSGRRRCGVGRRQSYCRGRDGRVGDGEWLWQWLEIVQGVMATELVGRRNWRRRTWRGGDE